MLCPPLLLSPSSCTVQSSPPVQPTHAQPTNQPTNRPTNASNASIQQSHSHPVSQMQKQTPRPPSLTDLHPSRARRVKASKLARSNELETGKRRKKNKQMGRTRQSKR
ncbi:hypothetical protein BC567DRAFT_216438 [Phyllosticta citribraziliensis]